MKWGPTGLFVLLCLQITASYGQFISNVFNVFDKRQEPCERDPVPLFKDVIYEFTDRITKSAAKYYNDRNFIVCPYTMWLSMAALAEFSDEKLKRELFQALLLPEQSCLRDKMFNLATKLEKPGYDVALGRKREIYIDYNVVISEDWKKFIAVDNLLSYRQIPLDLGSYAQAQETIGIQSKTNLEGNSFILDQLDYDAFWTWAFADGKRSSGPFYGSQGQRIAEVEYMVMKKPAKLARIPILEAKLLELPVGNNGRYSMLFTMGVENKVIWKILEFLSTSTIIQVLSAFTISMVPLDIVIPVFSLSSGLDVRPLLENVGLEKIFTDPDATFFVSNPPALPTGYLQRVSVNMTDASLKQQDGSSNLFGVFDVASPIASAVGQNFIANRPFIFTLIDTRTKVTIFTGVYSYPEPSPFKQ